MVWNQWQQPEGGVAEAEYSDYSEWTKDLLSEELEKRGLAKSGTKDELIARLQEDDAA